MVVNTARHVAVRIFLGSERAQHRFFIFLFGDVCVRAKVEKVRFVRRHFEISVKSDTEHTLGTELVFLQNSNSANPGSRHVLLPNLDMQAMLSHLPADLLDAPS